MARMERMNVHVRIRFPPAPRVQTFPFAGLAAGEWRERVPMLGVPRNSLEETTTERAPSQLSVQEHQVTPASLGRCA